MSVVGCVLYGVYYSLFAVCLLGVCCLLSAVACGLCLVCVVRCVLRVACNVL